MATILEQSYKLTSDQKMEIGRILSDLMFTGIGIAVCKVSDSNLVDALTRTEDRIVKVVDG